MFFPSVFSPPFLPLVVILPGENLIRLGLTEGIYFWTHMHNHSSYLSFSPIFSEKKYIPQKKIYFFSLCKRLRLQCVCVPFPEKCLSTIHDRVTFSLNENCVYYAYAVKTDMFSIMKVFFTMKSNISWLSPINKHAF